MIRVSLALFRAAEVASPARKLRPEKSAGSGPTRAAAPLTTRAMAIVGRRSGRIRPPSTICWNRGPGGIQFARADFHTD
jgi:hypothetical protein